jgi:hypothetical protein
MHHRPPERSERRTVARQLGTTLEAGDGIVRTARRVASAVLDPRRWQALALPCDAFFTVLPGGAITTASLPCGLAWSPAAPLAARVVQGAGAAIRPGTK